jgi:hypothetical protein
MPSGRLQAILNTAGTFTIIIPDSSHDAELSVALRLAHDLSSYHKLDAQIMEASAAEGQGLGDGNIVYIASTMSTAIKRILQQKRTPFSIKDSSLTLDGQVLDAAGLGTQP